MPVNTFKESHLRRISEVLADSVTHRELSELFAQCGIEEKGGTPKWERIIIALSARQQRDRSGNNIGAFIEAALDPARFTNAPKDHERLCTDISEILAFSGLRIGDRGKLSVITPATTLSEAEERASRLKENLIARRVHPDVLSFCRSELLQHNYFHAVLEATKSVAEKIRVRAVLGSDGAALVDQAFGGSTPRLAINRLETETERSEQKGFVNLLKGTFGTFRNVTGHAPKLIWPIHEDDALDLLTLAGYLHRRVDGSYRTPWNN